MGTTTLSGTPAFLGTSSVSYSAKDVRRYMTAAPIIYSAGGEGIVESGDFAVTQRAAGANQSVDVAAGEAYVKGDTSADEGSYYVRETSTLNVTLTAADATNPRIDRVVLEIKNDSEDGSGLNLARIRTIDGTPTVGATLTNLSGAAAVPNTCLLLANVLVSASDATIVTGDIQDRRFGVPSGGRKLFAGEISATGDSAGAGDKLGPMTAIGDGLTPVIVHGHIHAGHNAGAGVNTFVRIRDAAAGAGNVLAVRGTTHPASGYGLPHVFNDRLAAWSGSKSFYMNLQSGSGTPTAYDGVFANARFMYLLWGV